MSVLTSFQPSQRFCYAVIIAAVVFVSFAWYGNIDFQIRFAHADLMHYRAMAQAAPHLSPEVTAPFAYRLFAPWLVGLTFNDDVKGFKVMTLIAMLLVALQFFRVLRLHRFSSNLSLLCTLLLLANPYIAGLIFFDYFQLCDALTLLFMLLMLEAILRQQMPIFSLSLLCGALTRETSMVMIVVAIIYQLCFWGCARAFSALLWSLPAILVFIMARVLIVVPNHEWSLVSVFTDYWVKILSPVFWVRIVFNAFTPVALLAIVFMRDAVKFFKTQPHLFTLLILVFLSTLLGADVERLFAPACISVYLLVATLLEKHQLLRSTPFVVLLAFAALVGSLHYVVSIFSFGQVGEIGKIFYYSLCISAEIAVAVFALYRVRFDDSAESGLPQLLI